MMYAVFTVGMPQGISIANKNKYGDRSHNKLANKTCTKVGIGKERGSQIGWKMHSQTVLERIVRTSDKYVGVFFDKEQ